MSWIPINDYPGDQQYDAVPGTEHVSYWGQIGTNARYPGESNPAWSWTIMATDDDCNQWEAAGGNVATEAEAKTIVEAWTPPQEES